MSKDILPYSLLFQEKQYGALFYDVDADYVKYLKATEKAKRGFTRVPDVEYENERKMVCGVVLEMNGYKYYVPVSSYKKKQPNNL